MHAVVNLDKPKGITSQEAVTRVKRAFKAKRAGHAGTLDPLATGVLLVCLGEATKVTRFLMDLEKEYVATLKLGERTDTFDSEGKVIERVTDFSIDDRELQRVLAGFVGSIAQRPPMYSALKVAGKPLYELARKGLKVERHERTVEIRELTALGFGHPYLEIRVRCSKGTYIRSLADDIGRVLGVGAHITALRRTRVGCFSAEEAAGIEELPGNEAAIHSVDKALGHLREVVLTERDFSRARHGAAVEVESGRFTEGESLRMKDPAGRLFAIGAVSAGKLRIERILHLGDIKPVI